MTICIALKCKLKNKPVLLFASDRQESSAYLKRSTATKIKDFYGIKKPKAGKVDEWGMLIASAGDAFLADEVFTEINYFLSKKIKYDNKQPSIQLSVYRNEIGDIAYKVYKKHKDRGGDDPIFSLLIGACDDYSFLLYVTCEGKTKEIEDYAIIGSGRVTGGELLLAEFFKNNMTQRQAANLAALVISKVGRVDISVGGLPDIHMCRGRCTWVYKSKPFEEILVKSEKRWSLLKEAYWKMQSNSKIETEIKELLE